MEVFVKDIKIRPNQFQFFMNQFVQSLKEIGIKAISDNVQREKLKHIVSGIFKTLNKIGFLKLPKKSLIVASRGNKLLESAYPYYFGYQIIPTLWDVWPEYHEKLFSDLKTLRCKMVFVTVKSFAEKLKEEMGIDAYWIPEGIKVDDYEKGSDLIDRKWDVYELGRQLKSYDDMLSKLQEEDEIKTLYRNRYASDGKRLALAFPDAESLIRNLKNFKIIISFPKTITHPEEAGGIETMTQRYWEAMLSRCLILGSAPKELIEIAGYNPVIEVDFNNPEAQICHILNHVSEYQPLVDKNYEFALKNASWSMRAQQIRDILEKKGYNL